MKTLILHTGGTIGMAAAPGGYRPQPGFPERLRQQLEAHVSHSLPDYDIVELPPIDSADLRPSHWPAIARTLLDHWHDYTGFVILHGTDTMAWSASALSFMLRGTDKPVILTGAQIPLGEADSDALANVEGALHFAAADPVHEICLYFGGRLLRGNRSRKLAATRLDAFDSPNYPALAESGSPLQREPSPLPSEKRFINPEFDDQAVAILTLHPGIAGTAVDALTANPRVRGLILQTYGVGNAPQGDRELIAALERATTRGIILLNTTQCLIGGVSQETYATGTALARIGVISAGDMTLEAAFAKLHFLLASANDTDSVREGLQQSWCGEKS